MKNILWIEHLLIIHSVYLPIIKQVLEIKGIIIPITNRQKSNADKFVTQLVARPRTPKGINPIMIVLLRPYLKREKTRRVIEEIKQSVETKDKNYNRNERERKKRLITKDL